MPDVDMQVLELFERRVLRMNHELLEPSIRDRYGKSWMDIVVVLELIK